MEEVCSDEDRRRLQSELGFEKWEAVGHFMSDGDYLGFNKADYRGAIAEYEKAWNLLSTSWQRQMGGPDILEAIAAFGFMSGEPQLAKDILCDLLPRMESIATSSLQLACEKLAQLANQKA